MVYMLPDIAGDECHDITAHSEGKSIAAEGNLGFLAVEKRIVGPVSSTGTRRTGMERGKEGQTPRPRC